ncbi:MAG: hypothetical protein IPK04_11390 [Bdellovibrionales bacterium]|nr:hypothetical protein [Bdellovibrionales bacterium]
MKSLIEQFPKGSLQFEIGIQTWNPAVAALVSRKQDYQLISQNLHIFGEQPPSTLTQISVWVCLEKLGGVLALALTPLWLFIQMKYRLAY